jgi:transposase
LRSVGSEAFKELPVTGKMMQVLAEMEMLAHGTTQAWNPSGTGFAGAREFPPGELYPPHLWWAQEWARALLKEPVYEAALDVLQSWRRHEWRESESLSLEQLVVQDGEGYSVEMVAQRYGISEPHVRRIRAKNGRRTEDGSRRDGAKAVELGKMPADRRLAEVERMKAQGVSNRAIAWKLGVDEITVRRDLRLLKVAA